MARQVESRGARAAESYYFQAKYFIIILHYIIWDVLLLQVELRSFIEYITGLSDIHSY